MSNDKRAPPSAEQTRQEQFTWNRENSFDWFKELATFQALSVIENSRMPSLLDLACGDGTFVSQVQSHFKRVVGVDASSGQIEKARVRCPGAEFHTSLMEEFTTQERFSTISMIFILEHVIEPARTIREAGRLLDDKGVLIIHVPNAMAVNRRIARLMGTLKDEYELSPWDINVAGHRRSYDMKLLCNDVEAAGLRVHSTGGIFYKALSTPQIDWFLANGLWEDGGHGWGRSDGPRRDWRRKFCEACYEFGKDRPEECNVIYTCATKD